MKRVFLSYSSKNEQAVLSLEHDLKEIEIEVWIDTQLTGGLLPRHTLDDLIVLSGDILEVEGALTYLIAPVVGHQQPRLIIYADNGPDPELYEDLHDVEMLLKESETALNILLVKPIPIPGA